MCHASLYMGYHQNKLDAALVVLVFPLPTAI